MKSVPTLATMFTKTPNKMFTSVGTSFHFRRKNLVFRERPSEMATEPMVDAKTPYHMYTRCKELFTSFSTSIHTYMFFELSPVYATSFDIIIILTLSKIWYT